MSGSLIGTNVIAKLLNGDPEVIDLFDTLENIMISAITAGELFYMPINQQRSRRIY